MKGLLTRSHSSGYRSFHPVYTMFVLLLNIKTVSLIFTISFDLIICHMHIGADCLCHWRLH